MINIDILFELAAIFSNSKMATISHIGYVPTFKIHQICIEMTTQTHSEQFWSPIIACRAGATIFPKSKVAAVSHIGYVQTFKNHQICIEMTTQTYSDHFWSPVIVCHVAAKGFMFNQSITGGHLETDKMAEIPYSSHQSCPNEGFCMPK
jgi:hypothetical protein